jgi:hypothetical protein
MKGAAKEKIGSAHIIKSPKERAYIFIPEMKQKVVTCMLFNGKNVLKYNLKCPQLIIYNS